jgi:hypothetical protein
MLSELTIPLGEWYELGEAALAQWPLERIFITDVPCLIFTIQKAGDEWELEAGFELEERGVQATDADPGLWVIRESYPDRESLTLWLAQESESLVCRALHHNLPPAPKPLASAPKPILPTWAIK